MEIEKLLKIDCIETEKVGMIISNHINLMYEGDAAVTIKVWDALIADLIKWKSTAHNSEYVLPTAKSCLGCKHLNTPVLNPCDSCNNKDKWQPA